MRNKAFTLIELLIVVAIIVILAAIAVPNYLEAQTRSKVARTRNDLRTLAGALEAYRVDNNLYPRAFLGQALDERLYRITSPIAYLSALPQDPFFRGTRSGLTGFDPSYVYCSGNVYHGSSTLYASTPHLASIYSVSGRGPDGDIFFGGYCMAHPLALEGKAHLRGAYDPSNGTVSAGDVIRLGSGTMGE
jgi:type II secretion system protein G